MAQEYEAGGHTLQRHEYIPRRPKGKTRVGRRARSTSARPPGGASRNTKSRQENEVQKALVAGSPQRSLEPVRALQRAQKHSQIGWQGDCACGQEGAQHERHTSWFRPRTGRSRGRGCRLPFDRIQSIRLCRLDLRENSTPKSRGKLISETYTKTARGPLGHGAGWARSRLAPTAS